MYKKIGFYPENRLRKENNYFKSIEECLNGLGWNVVDYRLIYKDKDIRIVSLNFFENIIASNIVIALLKFVKRIFILLYLKATNRKIIFTMHNKTAHDTNYPKMVRLLIKT